MGIPSYFSHFVRQHRRIIQQINNKNKINNLYLDCNSFIYEGFNSNKTNTDEAVLIKYVCDKLIYYINLLKPNKNVFIAFDGVAPVAKLNQQRKRRYLSTFQSNFINEQIAEREKKNVIKSENNRQWSTSAITPGTLFMEKLTIEIKKRFNNPIEFGLETFIISCSDESGEGEHKIFEYIRNNKSYHKETTTVIYGLDADLIMLTLNHLHISNSLYLFRETPEFIKSIDSTLNPNELYLLDIPEFGKSIIRDFTDGVVAFNISELETKKQNLNKINDYVFMFFLLGNDFLPHFPSLNIRTNGIELLINAYKLSLNSKRLFLTMEGRIVWKNLRLLISYLSENELSVIKKEYSTRDKISEKKRYFKQQTYDKEIEYKLINIPANQREVERYINPNEDGWESRYYHILFDLRIDEDRKREICLNYLEGLEWTFKYYNSNCIDWRWTYKYDYPPLLVDLIKYIPFFETVLINKNETKPVNPIVQLSYVLPKNSLYLIPNNIGDKLLEKKQEWYTNNCEFQWAFCKYFWEAHVKLPEIDIDELEQLLAL